MAETHELRLKINAAAARAGSREFLAAINSIQKAVMDLDAKSSKAFSNIRARAKASGTALDGLVAGYNSARQANDKFAAAIAKTNSALQKQISLAKQARGGLSAMPTGGTTRTTTAAPTPRTTGGPDADRQAALQNRMTRAVDDSRLAVERLVTALMKVQGFQSINELGRAFRTFQREVSGASVSAQDFDNAKTKLNSTLKGAQTSLVTLTAKARDEARAEKEAADAARQRNAEAQKTATASTAAANATRQQEAATARLANVQISSANAMRTAEQETARLQNRLRGMGDTKGVMALNQALINLKARLGSGVSSTAELRAALSQFANETNAARLAIIRADGAKAQAARRSAELAVQERNAGNAARKLEADMRSAAGAANASTRAFHNATGSLRGLENAFSSTFQAGSLFRTLFGTLTLGAFTQGVFKAGDALQQFNITMEIASGSAKAAANDLSYIDNMARDLGTNLGASRDAFSKFAVASDIAGVSGEQTRKIFESVSTAMSVLGRGTQDQELAFLALEQMMSKGTVSAEELRRQLGERLPGAVSMMAEALNVSVGELQDMLKAGAVLSNDALPKFAAVLERRFGSQLDRTFNRAGSNLGRLQVEFTKFMETVANTGFLDELAIQFRDLTSAMRSEDVQNAAQTLGEGFAKAAEVAGNAAQWIITNIETIGRVASVVIGTLVYRQLVLMGQAALFSAQQFLVGLAGLMQFGRGATVATTQVNGLAAANTRAAASAVELGVAQAASGGRLMRLGGFAANLGRVAGAAAGPVGLLIAGLTLVPEVMRMISNSASNAAFDYGAAMRDMESSTFRFLDRARAIEELTITQKIDSLAGSISKAQANLSRFRNDEQAGEKTEAAFDAFGPDTPNSSQKILDTIRDLNVELLDTNTSQARAVKIADELKSAFIKVRDSVPEDKIRALEDAILPAAAFVKAMGEDQEKLNDITGGHAEKLIESNEQLAIANNNVLALKEGMGAIATAQVSPEVVAFLNTQPQGGLTETLAKLETSLLSLPNVSDGLLNSFGELIGKFEEGDISTQQLADGLQQLRPQFDAAANTAKAMGPAASSAADGLLTMADGAEQTAQQLATAESQAAGAEAGAYAVADAAYAAGAAGHSGAAGIRDLASAFASLGGSAGGAIAGINAGIAKMEREIEMKSADFVTRERMKAEDKFKGDLQSGLKQIDQAAVEAIRSNPKAREDIEAAARERTQTLRNAYTKAIDTAEKLASTPLNNKGRPKALTDKKGGGGGGGGGKNRLEALGDESRQLKKLSKQMNDRIFELERENQALELLASGQAATAESAELMATAMALGGGAIDEQTMAMVRQYEQAVLLNKQLQKLAQDPVKDWMESVPTWREAGRQIETEVFDSLSDTISNFIQTGEFSFEELGRSILSTVADIVADKAVKELATLLGGNTMGGPGEGGFGLGGLLGGLLGNGGSMGDVGDPSGGAQGAAIQTAFSTGGAQAGESIRMALLQGGQQVAQMLASGGTQAGATINSQMAAAGTSAGTQIGTQVATSGTISASQMGIAVNTSGATAANQMNIAIQSGGSVAAAQMGAAVSGGGGGGGEGGGGSFTSLLVGAGLSLLGSAFGGSSSSSTPAAPEPVTPVAIRSFAEGTHNTSGIPATLHDNEAVIPLSRGRKVPVEFDDDNMGRRAPIIQQTWHIQTPDADSFRRSQKQIAAQASASGQRALRSNG